MHVFDLLFAVLSHPEDTVGDRRSLLGRKSARHIDCIATCLVENGSGSHAASMKFGLGRFRSNRYRVTL